MYLGNSQILSCRKFIVLLALQLGLGDNTSRMLPNLVSLPQLAVTLVAGDSHACVILLDSSLSCWGRNGHGQVIFFIDSCCARGPVNVFMPF